MTERVQLVLGPPGTGKTTTLMNEVARCLEHGIAPERIAFVSFSRRAVREVLHRLGENPDHYHHFRTIHSTAYHMLELKREDVLQTEHWVHLSEITGTPFTAGGHDEPLYDGTLGDKVLGLHSLARARGTNLETEWRRAMLPDLPLYAVTSLVKQYERFKSVNGLWDFHDMITKAEGSLPVDVLFVDEAQDTSHAQWTFLRTAAREVPRVFLAGDDDQAVYGWSGADAEALIRFQGHRQVLPQSYRLPRAVKAFADRITDRIHIRVKKDFKPRDAEGEVEWRPEIEFLDLRGTETWLLLARSNYQLTTLVDLARQHGVVYGVKDGQWSWQSQPVRAAIVYEDLRKGKEVTRAQAKVMSPYLPYGLPENLPNKVTWGHIFNEAAAEMNWMDALSRMPLADREYLRALRREGESLHKPGRVRIGTIHSVKGAEADNVVILTDISRRVALGARANPDAELRVQYVGATRARQRLYLIQPTTPTHWQF